MAKRSQKIMIIIILIVTFVFALINYFNTGLVYHLIQGNAAEVSGIINSWGFFSPIIYVILVILEVLLAPIPGVFIYVMGGVSFGWFYGGTLALIGNVIGAYIAFFIGRRLGRDYVDKKVSKKSMRIFDDYSNKYGGLTLFLIRLNPITSSDIFSYLAGVTKLKAWEFLLWTTAAIAPLIYLQTSILGPILLNFKPLYWTFLIIGLLYLIFILYFTYFCHKKVCEEK